MLTPGEVISSQIRFNVSPAQIGDRELREKYLFFLQEGGEKIWTMAPVWWRLADDTASVTAGDGVVDLPLDFAQFGDEGHVYINGRPDLPALRYVDPAVMAGLIAGSTQSQQFPRVYTLIAKSPAGRTQLRVHPTTTGSLTLDILRYVARAPYLIDIPTAPNVTNGAVATLGVDAGVHRWRVVFKISGATAFYTEGGIVSSAKTVDQMREMELTDISVSPVWAVDEREIYRTEAGGEEYKLVGSISDNLTTTFTDTVPDSALGATCPVPATSVGCGLEQFPEDWQKTLLYEYLKLAAAQGQGDVRDQKWLENWKEEVLRMWGEMKQGQNFPKFLPRYGQKLPIGRYPAAIDRLRNA